MNRVAAIETALRCFACGLLALVPLLGLPFAVAAILLYAKSSTHSAGNWNPAGRYALLGFIFALIGSLITITGLCCAIVYYLEEMA